MFSIWNLESLASGKKKSKGKSNLPLPVWLTQKVFYI